MKFTVNWLKEYVDCDLEPAAIADRLTMLGLEVDSTAPIFPYLDTVVVARILSVEPHPNADRLVVCQADCGDRTLPVVCGAPNARPDMLTALALPGTELPDGTIRKAKIRGQVSEGMFCSERDLGLGTDHAGILELPADAPVGVSLRQLYNLDDTLIEIDLTPNRPDCTCVVGIAREIAGVTGRPLSQPDVAPGDLGGSDRFSVTVEAREACPRYAAKLIEGVTIGPSPAWLRHRLLAVGLRPVNNVVDITNYVMLELGQPLHAFDFDRLAGGAIVVRHPRVGETITTLDGVERRLEPDMLCICDADKPVAVAGVMGGANSEVGDDTTTILLESACFDPVSIRRTSRRLGLSTDASYRFERGVDPSLAPRALARAAALIEEIAGGRAVAGGFDAGGEAISEPAPIRLRIGRVRDLLGIDIDRDRVAHLLAGIEIPSQPDGEDALVVRPPSFRVDIEREVDCIEEVARLVGYDSIAAAMPSVPLACPAVQPERDLRRRIAAVMAGCGFWEAVNYSFVDAAHFDMLGLNPEDPKRSVVRLRNPISENQAVLRTMLLPGLLVNAAHNCNHQEGDVRLFEIGKIFLPRPDADQPDEHLELAAVMTGRRYANAPMFHFGDAPVDFFDVKGVAETLVAELRLADVALRADTAPPYADGDRFLAVWAGDRRIGMVGCLAPAVRDRFDLRRDVFFLVFDLAAVAACATTPMTFTPLPRYPAVVWDLAVVVPEAVPAGDIVAHIEGLDEPLVEAVELFDVYRGKPLAEGTKSVGLTIRYRSREKTLDDATVAKVHQRITTTVLERFEGSLRGE